MKLENYEVHLPNYSIGETIYDKIGPVCESYGKTVLLIGGPRQDDMPPNRPLPSSEDFQAASMRGLRLYDHRYH